MAADTSVISFVSNKCNQIVTYCYIKVKLCFEKANEVYVFVIICTYFGNKENPASMMPGEIFIIQDALRRSNAQPSNH